MAALYSRTSRIDGVLFGLFVHCISSLRMAAYFVLSSSIVILLLLLLALSLSVYDVSAVVMAFVVSTCDVSTLSLTVCDYGVWSDLTNPAGLFQ